MPTHCGFSLIEVLVSLVFVSSTSLGLLHQQWQFSARYNQSHVHVLSVLQADNAYERSIFDVAAT